MEVVFCVKLNAAAAAAAAAAAIELPCKLELVMMPRVARFRSAALAAATAKRRDALPLFATQRYRRTPFVLHVCLLL